MEAALKQVHDVFTKWKIMVNTQKTQAINLTRRRKACFPPQNSINFNNNTIIWECSAKYLGAILNQKLKFKSHIPYIIDKINELTRIMYSLINRNSKLSIENKKLILISVFHAIMFFAAPVWSSSAQCHIRKLQIAQN